MGWPFGASWSGQEVSGPLPASQDRNQEVCVAPSPAVSAPALIPTPIQAVPLHSKVPSDLPIEGRALGLQAKNVMKGHDAERGGDSEGSGKQSQSKSCLSVSI